MIQTTRKFVTFPTTLPFGKTNCTFVSKIRNGNFIRRLVVPESLRTEILTKMHEQSGHQGIQRTYALLQERFWWENMFKDVCEHIASCSCRMSKLRANKWNDFVGDHITVTERWHTLACDWLYTGRRGKYNSHYVLTIVDLCTRYSVAIPTPDKSGKSLVRALRMLFAFNGYPQRLVSDNESMFRSQEFVEWLNIKGIEKTFTAVYNPRANGIDERFNQTLMNMINSCSYDRNWDEDVWELFYYYNIGTNAAHGESPFYLQFLRKGRLPIDLSYNKKLPGEDEFFTVQDIKSELNKAEHRAMEKALKLIEDKHIKLDHRTRMTKFRRLKVGDKVIIKQPNLETQPKSAPIAQGPYTIHRIIGHNSYKVRDETGKKLKFVMNGRRLALITPRKKLIRNTPQNVDEFEWIQLPGIDPIKQGGDTAEVKTTTEATTEEAYDFNPSGQATQSATPKKPRGVRTKQKPDKELSPENRKKEQRDKKRKDKDWKLKRAPNPYAPPKPKSYRKDKTKDTG